jgi:hypothetical protein
MNSRKQLPTSAHCDRTYDFGLSGLGQQFAQTYCKEREHSTTNSNHTRIKEASAYLKSTSSPVFSVSCCASFMPTHLLNLF